jgi:hypothetical protein
LTEYRDNYDRLSIRAGSLRQMQNVVVCDLTYLGWDKDYIHDDDDAPTPIHLPHFRRLAITEEGKPSGDCLPGLIDILTLPQFEQLAIESTSHGVFEHLMALVARSGCALRDFRVGTDDEIYEDILPFLGEVSTLTFSCQITPTATIVGLTRGLSVSAPPPALRVLKINTKLRIAAEIPQATFRNMIRSRIGASPTSDARLEVVEINKTSWTVSIGLSSWRCGTSG